MPENGTGRRTRNDPEEVNVGGGNGESAPSGPILCCEREIATSIFGTQFVTNACKEGSQCIQYSTSDCSNLGNVRLSNGTSVSRYVSCTQETVQTTQPRTSVDVKKVTCCEEDGANPGICLDECIEYLTPDGECPDGSFDEGGAAAIGVGPTRYIPCIPPQDPPEEFTVEVSTNNDLGTAGVRKSTDDTLSNNVSVLQNQTVLIEATWDNESVTFNGWFEGDEKKFDNSRVDIIVQKTYNLQARFEERAATPGPGQITISIIAEPPAGGNVKFSSATAFTKNATQAFNLNQNNKVSVGVEAQVADDRYQFDGWFINDTVASNSLSFTRDYTTGIRLVARFSLKPGEEITTQAPTTQPPTTEPPRTWKRCSDGDIRQGDPPTGWRIATYRGFGGGACYEPAGVIGFDPSPNELDFVYQRGSGNFPSPMSFTVSNPSYAIEYRVTLETNSTYFTVTPSQFILGPIGNASANTSVRISVNDNIEALGDGLTTFDLRVRVEEV